MRVVTGVISHETSTFTPVATTWENYYNERFGYLRGDEILSKFRGTNSSIGGFADSSRAHKRMGSNSSPRSTPAHSPVGQHPEISLMPCWGRC